MNSLILRIVQWINTGKLSKDDVLKRIDLLLAIDPEHFKTADDIIARYNYLRCIGLDKVQIKKNCSEILKENHEYVYELFDNFNALVNNEELSPQEELVQDIVSILHVFSCRLYGLRKYKKQIEGDEEIAKELKDGNKSDSRAKS